MTGALPLGPWPSARGDHREAHLVSRTGWLRAAVLGANDGIVSTASLIIGVAASGATHQSILVSGIAGLVAGAMSMAAGEYVSVSSQADTERADLAREKKELASDPAAERDELAGIYERRGLDAETARIVVNQMTAFDALATHARDELHITDVTAARPVTAALASAATFTAGASLPLLVAALAPTTRIVALEAIGSLLFLAALGWLGAFAGGAAPARPVARVIFWGGACDGHYGRNRPTGGHGCLTVMAGGGAGPGNRTNDRERQPFCTSAVSCFMMAAGEPTKHARRLAAWAGLQRCGNPCVGRHHAAEAP